MKTKKYSFLDTLQDFVESYLPLEKGCSGKTVESVHGIFGERIQRGKPLVPCPRTAFTLLLEPIQESGNGSIIKLVKSNLVG